MGLLGSPEAADAGDGGTLAAVSSMNIVLLLCGVSALLDYFEISVCADAHSDQHHFRPI